MKEYKIIDIPLMMVGNDMERHWVQSLKERRKSQTKELNALTNNGFEIFNISTISETGISIIIYTLVKSIEVEG